MSFIIIIIVVVVVVVVGKSSSSLLSVFVLRGSVKWILISGFCAEEGEEKMAFQENHQSRNSDNDTANPNDDGEDCSCRR